MEFFNILSMDEYILITIDFNGKNNIIITKKWDIQ